MVQKLTGEEVDAFMGRLKLLLGGIIALLVVPLILYAVYLDRRLDSFEDSLRYRPPAETADVITFDDFQPQATEHVQGQLVYVPAYSHIYHEDGSPYLLTITLSVRNTSVDRAIIVRSVRFFDTSGKEVKSYLKQPLSLAPLATTEFLVERNDTSGGSGANFLVDWVANQPVTEPIIEAVMIDTKGNQGISFARSGAVIAETRPQESSETED